MTPVTHGSPVEPDIFRGGGGNGRTDAGVRLEPHAIGPPETWSQALKTTVRILQTNRFPLLLWWGPEYVSIYNDAYRPILGKKHPWGLGKPFRECWSEVAHILEPLQLVFQNQIGNAIKYRRPGVKPEVHVSARLRSEQWIFSVRDNGIGIEPEHRERIFGLFKRLHRNDSYGGSGVGLAICKRIIERYAGVIWVESEPDKGSTFKFTLDA